MRMCGVPAASIQPAGADLSYYCLPFEDLGIARLSDVDALSGWFEEPGSTEAPASAALHLAAYEKATNRVLHTIGAQRSVPAL
jgi:hypothetical protein